MRGTLVVLAVLGMLVHGAPTSAVEGSAAFTDVAGTTHEATILAVTDADITSGYPDGSYRPAAPVTRGQVATVLAGALDLPSGAPSAFSDVAGTTHAPAVGALVGEGLADGFPDDTFRPDQVVTRGQVATLLTGAFELPADDRERFADVDGTTHEAGIGALAASGIAGGVTDLRFAPNQPVTRGQLATFVARGLELAPRQTPLPPLDERDRDPDLDVDVRLEPVASMGSPTAGAIGPDGTLYLAERAGTVHPLTDEGIGPAVVDVSGRTSTGGERGLLGIAFGDDELYLSYTDRSGDTVLAGVALDDDGTVLDDRQRTVFTVGQPASNHNGGHVTFGPDGFLYLGLGDGGGSGDPSGNAQDLTTPLGAILRIDPRADDPYAVPSDNPFVDVEGAADEIFAYGLRNPWRFSFDRERDVLWIADVGQGRREEIDRLPLEQARGANLGWNLMEGTLSFAGSAPDGHVPPVHEYETHGPEGCAVTGGYVYTGTAIPQLRGAYLYADFCNGAIRGLVVDEDGEVVAQDGLGIDGGQVVSFVEDAEGELYVLDLGGQVQRIAPA